MKREEDTRKTEKAGEAGQRVKKKIELMSYFMKNFVEKVTIKLLILLLVNGEDSHSDEWTASAGREKKVKQKGKK